MKNSIKGVYEIRKKLSNGTTASYWYHRASQTRLPGALGSIEFLTAYMTAENHSVNSGPCVSDLISEYIGSPKFTSLKPRTRDEYLRMLKHLELEFGDMPIKALENLKVRGEFIDYQEKTSLLTPREADNRLSVMSAVFSYSFDKGRLSRNPIASFSRLHKSDRADIIWTETDVTRFMKNASIGLQRAMILALHTGQRYGDLIRLRWSDFDGAYLKLTQSKTSSKVRIYCTTTLLRMLTTSPRTCPFILARPDGRPWFTEKDDKQLAKAWRAQMEAAGFYPTPLAQLSAAERRAHLHFNDIRGTAITLLAEAGATVPQIVSITGHSLQSATRILERYLSITQSLSRAAMIAFENAPETKFANRLQTGPDRSETT